MADTNGRRLSAAVMVRLARATVPVPAAPSGADRTGHVSDVPARTIQHGSMVGC